MSVTHFEPSTEDIVAAHARIAGHALRTPILHSADLDDRVGARVLIKPENLQQSGSFKLRGRSTGPCRWTITRRPAGSWPGPQATTASPCPTWTGVWGSGR